MAKCPACNAAINTNWRNCIVCDVPLSPPLDLVLAEAVKGTTLTFEEFKAQLSAYDIEGIASGEVEFECLQVAARSMEAWLKAQTGKKGHAPTD